MGLTRKLLVLGLTVVVTAGCETRDITGPFTIEGDIARAEAMKAADGSFNEHLRQMYVERAMHEYDPNGDADYGDAKYMAEQAIMAGSGNTPPPADPDDAFWDLPEGSMGELTAARKDMLALFSQTATEKAPFHAAVAQVSYDCWVEEQEENHEFDEIKVCRSQFDEAMEQMRLALKPKAEPEPKEPMAMAEPVARDYLVFFDFDQASIRADAARILDQVTEAIGTLDVGGIELIGHADRAGSSTYNQRLSERRAANVKTWLGEHGVSTEEITTSGKGETDPRVTTPDGVREQENRRVEIHLK